jgi:hypothetical protein
MAYGEYAAAKQVIRVESYEAFAEVLLDRIRRGAAEKAQATKNGDEPVSLDLKVNVHFGGDGEPAEMSRRDICVCTFYGDIWICRGGICSSVC